MLLKFIAILFNLYIIIKKKKFLTAIWAVNLTDVQFAGVCYKLNNACETAIIKKKCPHRLNLIISYSIRKVIYILLIKATRNTWCYKHNSYIKLKFFFIVFLIFLKFMAILFNLCVIIKKKNKVFYIGKR